MPGHTQPESAHPTDDARAETPTVENASSAAAMTAATDAAESAAADSGGSAATSVESARPAEADSENETDWQAIVAEKDELIAALTERLEEAAEQLDRLKRTVGENGLLVAGLPRPVVEQQQRLASMLSDVLDAWTDPEHSPWDEITRRLDRLDVALHDGFEAQAELIASLREAAAASHSRPPAAPTDEQNAVDAPADAATDNDLPAQQENQTAAQPTVAGTEADAQTPAADLRSTQSSVEAAFDHVSDLLAAADGGADPEGRTVLDVTELALPEPIADDETDVQTLQAAVAERDECIVSLLRSLRQALHPDRAIPWREVLSGTVQDESRLAHIEQLEQRLQEALRTAEIELSLERAQLAREKTRLQRELEQLQRTRPQGSQDADTPRWLRFLAGSKRS
ncbi:MAG: hypothetical protein D6725_08080 [Planctomycetota bacterium]|nr:MAG: hypothetical protein D6725_08080 [Planctomycetota bacterium]